MARVVVTPEEFTMVNFDAGVIKAQVEEIADRIGLPADAEVRLEIDEKTPLGRAKLTSIDPVVMEVEGGALEDPTNPRHWSDRSAVIVVGRLLMRALDRRGGSFGDAPAEGEMSLQQTTAWDAYSFGRLQRLGYDGRKPRAQYHFRNRHGFTDAADTVLERLWNGEDLGWSDIEAACQETASAKTPA